MFNIFTIETKKNAAILRAMVLIIVAVLFKSWKDGGWNGNC